MSSIVFDTWSAETWAREVEDSASLLPAEAEVAVRLIFVQGHSYEEAARMTNSHPTEMVVQTCLGVRLIQEHLQRRHATIDPPWPRTGTGVPGAPIPRYKAVIAALATVNNR